MASISGGVAGYDDIQFYRVMIHFRGWLSSYL
jgi:hypothetical protein